MWVNRWKEDRIDKNTIQWKIIEGVGKCEKWNLLMHEGDCFWPQPGGINHLNEFPSVLRLQHAKWCHYVARGCCWSKKTLANLPINLQHRCRLQLFTIAATLICVSGRIHYICKQRGNYSSSAQNLCKVDILVLYQRKWAWLQQQNYEQWNIIP